jgi:hypothetical protein
MFSNVWIAKLPWAKTMVGFDGKLHIWWGVVFAHKLNKLLVPKFCNLLKLVGRHKYKVIRPNCNVG